MRLALKSLLYSLPIWAFVLVDSAICPIASDYTAKAIMYYLGWYLYAIVFGRWNAVVHPI